MLGGCYWPLEIVNSRLMLAASNFVPQGWAMKSLKSIIIYGQDFQAAVMPSLILIVMGIIFLGVSVVMDNE
jgi:ABC-2 type transport system permease protein